MVTPPISFPSHVRDVFSFPQGRGSVCTYGENSPSLCPTISSMIVMGLYTLPLYTSKVSPTKLGRTVAERACVRMGGWYLPSWGRTSGRLYRHGLVSTRSYAFARRLRGPRGRGKCSSIGNVRDDVGSCIGVALALTWA